MIYRITNKGGEAGFKFFKENDEEEQNEQEQDILKLNKKVRPRKFSYNIIQHKKVYSLRM